MPKCATPYCRRDAGNRKHCSTCRSRASRANNPIRHAWNNHRAHCIERGIFTCLSFEFYAKWCCRVKYIGFTNQSATGACMDRLHEGIGYVPNNINQNPLTRSENVKKYFSYDWQTKQIAFTSGTTTEIQEDFDAGFDKDNDPPF